jgi:large subunit ribosomal protein L15
MQYHNLSHGSYRRKSRRIGRGGKRGTYSGRGIKGQKARAGAKIRPAERDIIKRIPKLRGYRFKSFRPKPATVNLEDIQKRFEIGEAVTPDRLLEKGLVRRIKGKVPVVKVLGGGELKKNLEFKDVIFSKSAAKKLKRDS